MSLDSAAEVSVLTSSSEFKDKLRWITGQCRVTGLSVAFQIMSHDQGKVSNTSNTWSIQNNREVLCLLQEKCQMWKCLCHRLQKPQCPDQNTTPELSNQNGTNVTLFRRTNTYHEEDRGWGVKQLQCNKSCHCYCIVQHIIGQVKCNSLLIKTSAPTSWKVVPFFCLTILYKWHKHEWSEKLVVPS